MRVVRSGHTGLSDSPGTESTSGLLVKLGVSEGVTGLSRVSWNLPSTYWACVTLGICRALDTCPREHDYRQISRTARFVFMLCEGGIRKHRNAAIRNSIYELGTPNVCRNRSRLSLQRALPEERPHPSPL